MENNQAFGWLMKSASALLTPANGGHNSIEGCNDISTLIDGVARDFEAATSAASASSNDSTTAENNNNMDAAAAAAAGTEETTNTTTNNNNNIHLENLTARLDRIKTLLYEERSTSSAAVTQNGGSINLNWTPSVATEVFKCFTGLKNSNSDGDGDGRKRNDGHDDATMNNNDGINNTNNGSSNNEDGATTTKATTIDLLPKLLQNLHSLPFEARKSISAIFNYLLVCGLDGGVEAVQFASVSTAFGSYVLERAQLIIGTLVYCHGTQQQQLQQQQGVVSGGGGAVKDGGQKNVDITLLCGSMLRSSLRHASIYQWVLNDEHCEQFVYPFLDEYVHDPNFDVSSDALETVRVMFTGLVAPNGGGGGGGGGGFDGYNDDSDTAYEEYKQQMESIAAEFLDRKYDPIINDRMNKKCISSNAAYMTRRMSLQLLSTILLNRSNFNVMMRYISSSQNLVTILCLLRDPSPHITLDAFQVFKIFVANPGKPVDVVKILFDNKVKLIKYLTNLHKEREGSDEQYRDEKGLVIATLEGLEMPADSAVDGS